jgi:hypothetical protein
MSKKINYCQCRLQKTGKGVHWEQTSFIPEEFAVEGKIIKLRDKEGVWDDGWEVMETGAVHSEDNMPDWHSEIKHHRKNTGDAEPKRV